MPTQRKRHGAAMKAKVACEAITGQRTVKESAGQYDIEQDGGIDRGD